MSNGGQGEEMVLQRGISLFNRRNYFEAHEVWEDWWRSTTGKEKLTIQGMVQTAVAMHHYSTGNYDGARSVMDRALRNLDGAGVKFHGVDIVRLREDMRRTIRELREETTVTYFKIVQR